MRLTKLGVMQLLASTMGASHPQLAGVNTAAILGRQKGQIRAAKPKPSGAAIFKRTAKKRNNIRKNK